MKAFCLYCFAALFVGAVLVSHGVTDETPDPFGDSPGEFELSETVVEVPAPRNEVDDLRAKYLEAAQQRAEMMDEEALRQAIETEEKSVAELRARQSLKEVEQELQRITKEYSDTTAGQHAALLFKQLQQLSRNGRSKRFEAHPGESLDDLEPLERWEDNTERSRNERGRDPFDTIPPATLDDGSFYDVREPSDNTDVFDSEFRGT